MTNSHPTKAGFADVIAPWINGSPTVFSHDTVNETGLEVVSASDMEGRVGIIYLNNRSASTESVGYGTSLAASDGILSANAAGNDHDTGPVPWGKAALYVKASVGQNVNVTGWYI